MTDQLLQQWLDSGGDLAMLPQQFDATMFTPRLLLTRMRDAILGWLDAGAVATIERAVQVAWTLAQQSGQAEDEALAHWCHGVALFHRDMRAALGHLDAAYAFYHAQERRVEQGRLLIGRAGLLGQLGRLAEAEGAISTAARYLADVPEQQQRLPALYLNRSDIEGRLGHYAAMQATARTAEALALAYDQPAAQAAALINQAFAALFLGEFAPAEAALHQAAIVARSLDSAEFRARVAVNQARLAAYRGQLFAALRLLEQARLDFATARIDIDQATVAIEEASLYERLHLPYAARQAALQAADMFVQAGLTHEAIEAIVQAARLALGLGQGTAARNDVQRAQALAEQSTVAPVLQGLLAGYAAHPRLQRTAAARRNAYHQALAAATRLAQAGIVAEQLEVALIAADLAAALRLAEARDQYRQIADRARSQGLVLLEQQALVGLAGTLRPAAACAPLQRAVDLATLARRSMPVEELKASYLSGTTPLYARLITAYRKARQPDAAFRMLLEARGSIWAELTAPAAEHDATLPLFDPAWLRAKTELHYWQEQLHPDNDPDYQALCRERVMQAETTLNTLARQQTRHRSAHALPDLAAIQQALPADSVAVEYLVDASQIAACLISATGQPQWIDLGAVAPVIERLGKLALLRRALQQSSTPEHQRHLAEAQLPAVRRLLSELYACLIAPLEALSGTAAARLIIAPDGILASVPWAALGATDAATGDPDARLYLDQRYELIILPSVALLALPYPKVASGPPLALGYAGQPALSQIEAELAAIQRLFPTTRCRNPATLRDVLWETPPQYLHCAMHGQVNPQSPLLSRLVLADGSLLLADVLNLSLHGTRLVTLSACDTGVVPERGGLALALAGSFLLAGAQAVVASLWPADDAATALMMERFYTGLAAGRSIPQALSQARTHLRAAGYAHPYYWATFQALMRSVSPPATGASTPCTQD